MLARLELRVAAIDDADVFHNATIDHLAVRRLDEPKLVNARKGGKTRNKSDAGTFRGLNRTNTLAMRAMDVAYLGSGTLAGKTSRPKCRKTSFECYPRLP